MKEMWDSRYSVTDYAYGTEPNVFLKEAFEKYKLKGHILFPAEGEGRNAVYAAKKGLQVTAFDFSVEGKKKALRLATKEHVSINYEVGDFFELELINHQYDAVALIYVHFPSHIMSKYYRKIAELIKSNGLIFLVGFSKNNLKLKEANPSVGGPDKLEMLFSIESINKEFPDVETIELEEVYVDLSEGQFHKGKGSVIRFIGRKK